MRQGDTETAVPASGIATRRFQDLPGPKGVPFFGNALQIEKNRVHEQFELWSREFGPFFRVRIGPRRLLVVSDHAVIASVLRDRPKAFRRPTHHGDIVREMGFELGLFFVNDEVWKNQRRMVMAAFDPGHLRAYFPSLLNVVQRLHGRWDRAAKAGGEIDLQADLMRYTVDAIAGLAFGSDVNTLESDDDTIQRHLNQIFPAIARRVTASVRYWRFVKLPADRRLERSVREVKMAIEDFIIQARKRILEPAANGRPRNLLEATIAAEDGSNTSDRDIAGNVVTMLLAGEDTTANTMAWMLDLLYRDPDVLRRAREEVRRIAPDVSRFTIDQMDELNFVEACIHETMRLKPVAPLLPSQANGDTVIADIEVPADTIVIGLMRRDATDDRYFPEPEKFDPDRWLGGGPHSPNAKSPTRVSMPFGAGPRLCPGRNLALLEIKMAMAMLLGNFSIDRVGAADGKPARELFAFAMGPVGLRMKLSTAQMTCGAPAT